MPGDYLETEDIVRHSKLTTHMVGYLCRYEILCPSLSRTRQRGLRRRFSFADLLLARAIATLLSAKVEVMSVRKALQTLRSKIERIPPSVLASHRVVIVGQAVYLNEPNNRVIELTADGQLAFQFMLDTTDVSTKSRQSGRTRKSAGRRGHRVGT